MTRLAGKVCLVTRGATGRRSPEGEAATQACRKAGAETVFILSPLPRLRERVG